jgi:predicted aldo/keto reductase-like oxidoreductase
MNVSSSKSNRRDFLKKGISGAAAIALFTGCDPAAEKKDVTKNGHKKKIIYRTLGRTGIKIPIISYGCGNTQNGSLVRMALDMGIRHLDTAGVYRGGANQIMVGEILKGRPRQSFVIATKIGPLRDNRRGLISELIDQGISPERLKKDCQRRMDNSLKRLGLDYVDICYLYEIDRPDDVRYPLIKDVLLDLKKQGKVKFLGVSTHQNEPAVIRAAVEEKIYDVVLTAYNFRQPHWRDVKQAIAHAAQAGLGVVGMKLLGGVYYDKERKLPVNAKAAIKWVLQDENVHTIIPGITTFDQLETDMSIMEDLSFTPQEKADLQLGEKTGMTGLYCPQCGNCRSQCRYQLDIPTLMRCYMYAYGYKSPAKAKMILQDKDLEMITCRQCSSCAVSCTMDFDVPGKIKDILRVLEVPEDFLV